MPPKDLISAEMTDADEAKVHEHVDGIRQTLKFLIDLSATERKELPKTGPKTVDFVNGCLALAEQNPDILPRNLDLQEFKRDVDLLLRLQRVGMEIEKLNELVQDTMVAVGSDAFVAALRVYRAAQNEGQAEGLDAAVGALGARFRKTKKKPGEQ